MKLREFLTTTDRKLYVGTGSAFVYMGDASGLFDKAIEIDCEFIARMNRRLGENRNDLNILNRKKARGILEQDRFREIGILEKRVAAQEEYLRNYQNLLDREIVSICESFRENALIVKVDGKEEGLYQTYNEYLGKKEKFKGFEEIKGYHLLAEAIVTSAIDEYKRALGKGWHDKREQKRAQQRLEKWFRSESCGALIGSLSGDVIIREVKRCMSIQS